MYIPNGDLYKFYLILNFKLRINMKLDHIMFMFFLNHLDILALN